MIDNNGDSRADIIVKDNLMRILGPGDAGADISILDVAGDKVMLPIWELV